MFSRSMICGSAGLALAAGMLTAQAKPTEPNGVEAIRAYAGVWKTHMEHFDTAYSKAGKEDTELRNDCWSSGAYFACRQIVNGDPKVLIVFTCRNAHDCTSYQIPPDGQAAGGPGKVLLEGNTWTFPWSDSEGGKTTYFRVVNVWTSAKTIEFRQEFSADQEHWTRMASGHEEKIADH